MGPCTGDILQHLRSGVLGRAHEQYRRCLERHTECISPGLAYRTHPQLCDGFAKPCGAHSRARKLHAYGNPLSGGIVFMLLKPDQIADRVGMRVI